MHKMLVLVAAVAATLGSSAAMAQFPLANGEIKVQLDPNDPKFRTAECAQLREKARTYTGGSVTDNAGSFIVALGAPGGGVASFGAEMRKRELIQASVEKACMSNPPSRPHLDPAATIGK